MKKVIVVLLILLGFFGQVMAASTTVGISDATGSKGSTVSVPIDLAGASKVGSLDISLAYDPAVLSAVGVEKGELAGNALMKSNTKTPGEISIALADPYGMSGDGSVIVITFEVLGETGVSSPITIEEAKAYNAETLVDILLDVKSGSFTVIEEAASKEVEEVKKAVPKEVEEVKKAVPKEVEEVKKAAPQRINPLLIAAVVIVIALFLVAIVVVKKKK